MNLDCAVPEDMATECTAQGLFKFKKPRILPQRETQASKTGTLLNALSAPLPLSSLSLTRSQLIFSAATSINAQSLAVERGDEFYLFMDMRETHQWSSFTMNSQKWVAATKLYNEALAQSRKSKGLSLAIKKNPRALMEKLGEIEANVMKRLVTKDFICKWFWFWHIKILILIHSISTSKRY
jgi:hypothetical protein